MHDLHLHRFTWSSGAERTIIKKAVMCTMSWTLRRHFVKLWQHGGDGSMLKSTRRNRWFSSEAIQHLISVVGSGIQEGSVTMKHNQLRRMLIYHSIPPKWLFLSKSWHGWKRASLIWTSPEWQIIAKMDILPSTGNIIRSIWWFKIAAIGASQGYPTFGTKSSMHTFYWTCQLKIWYFDIQE